MSLFSPLPRTQKQFLLHSFISNSATKFHVHGHRVEVGPCGDSWETAESLAWVPNTMTPPHTDFRSPLKPWMSSVPWWRGLIPRVSTGLQNLGVEWMCPKGTQPEHKHGDDLLNAEPRLPLSLFMLEPLSCAHHSLFPLAFAVGWGPHRWLRTAEDSTEYSVGITVWTPGTEIRICKATAGVVQTGSPVVSRKIKTSLSHFLN